MGGPGPRSAGPRGSSRASRRRVTLLLIVGVVVTGLAVLAYASDALGGPERSSIDARFAIRGDRPPPTDVVLVEVDDATFDQLPQYQWPYPRQLHARVIDRIAADHPKAIAYDVQFTENPKSNAENVALAESIYGATSDGVPVVLATTETNGAGGTRILGGGGVLSAIHAQAGSALFVAEADNAIRRVAYAIGGLQTFAVATAQAADHRRVDLSRFAGGPAWIDYYGPAGTIPSVPFYRVLEGQVPRGFFTNKIVLVGASATSLQDLHATPVGPLMPGVEVEANAMQTVRLGLPLASSPAGLDIALILLLGLAAPLASLRLSPLRALSLAIVIGGAFALACQVAFDDAGLIVSFAYPIAALLLTCAGSLGVHYATAALERERVRDLFSRFVPESVVSEVLARAGQDLRLGGIQRVCTVMFIDLRGFTSFAEELSPDRVIAVLNEYLSAMSDAILDHGGTLVAYMGDGVMAVFGAPIEAEGHADQALGAAREMLDQRLPRFNAWLAGQGMAREFRMGIGLNSGQVMSGNVGSERRVEYAAIGDTTNTASRVEGITKTTAHQLLFTDATRRLLRDPPPDMVFVDEFEIKGRKGRVELWSLNRSSNGEEPGDLTGSSHGMS